MLPVDFVGFVGKAPAPSALVADALGVLRDFDDEIFLFEVLKERECELLVSRHFFANCRGEQGFWRAGKEVMQ